MKFLIIFFVMFFLMMIWDFGRFYDVDIAETTEQLEIACEKYEMSSIRDIPIKCTNLLNEKLK